MSEQVRKQWLDWQNRVDARVRQTTNELFDAPFNLAGEPLRSEIDAEGEARVRALAESEARKAQFCLIFSPLRHFDGGYSERCGACGFPESAHNSKSA